jgi:hypothetical protein
MTSILEQLCLHGSGCHAFRDLAGKSTRGATRQAQYDEAGHDDDNSDRAAPSWHIHLPRLFVIFMPQ